MTALASRLAREGQTNVHSTSGCVVAEEPPAPIRADGKTDWISNGNENAWRATAGLPYVSKTKSRKEAIGAILRAAMHGVLKLSLVVHSSTSAPAQC